jgi:hypothetical protein
MIIRMINKRNRFCERQRTFPGSVEAEPLMNHVDDHDDGHKRYIEDYLWNGQKPGVQRLVNLNT